MDRRVSRTVRNDPVDGVCRLRGHSDSYPHRWPAKFLEDSKMSSSDFAMTIATGSLFGGLSVACRAAPDARGDAHAVKRLSDGEPVARRLHRQSLRRHQDIRHPTILAHELSEAMIRRVREKPPHHTGCRLIIQCSFKASIPRSPNHAWNW